MKNLTPWAWIDDQNNLRFDVPKMLETMNVRDTPENRDIAVSAANALLHELFPDVPIFNHTRELGTLKIHPSN